MASRSKHRAAGLPPRLPVGSCLTRELACWTIATVGLPDPNFVLRAKWEAILSIIGVKADDAPGRRKPVRRHGCSCPRFGTFVGQLLVRFTIFGWTQLLRSTGCRTDVRVSKGCVSISIYRHHKFSPRSQLICMPIGLRDPAHRPGERRDDLFGMRAVTTADSHESTSYGLWNYLRGRLRLFTISYILCLSEVRCINQV